MLRRTIFGAAVVVMATVSAALPGAEAGSATVGQVFTPNGGCTGGDVFIQLSVAAGTSYTVPAGTWQVTSWSVRAGATVGPEELVVVRSTGVANTYRFVGVSTAQTPVANTLNTFPTSITTQGGDIIGIWNNSGGALCALTTGNAADSYGVAGPVAPTVGATTTVLPTPTVRIDIAANLVQAGGGDDVSHVFVCYSRWEHDGGEVETEAQATLLVDAGRWLPGAILGDIPDGENHGAYHLDCNPPPPLQATNEWLGDGGDVVDFHSSFYYRIYR